MTELGKIEILLSGLFTLGLAGLGFSLFLYAKTPHPFYCVLSEITVALMIATTFTAAVLKP